MQRCVSRALRISLRGKRVLAAYMRASDCFWFVRQHTFCRSCCTDIGLGKWTVYASCADYSDLLTLPVMYPDRFCPLDNTKLSSVVKNIAVRFIVSSTRNVHHFTAVACFLLEM